MTNILPQQAGLTVGSVIYKYRAIKDPESDMIVYVQNENALGDGYIFREEDPPPRHEGLRRSEQLWGSPPEGREEESRRESLPVGRTREAGG